MNDPFDVEFTADELHAGDLIDADLGLLRALVARRKELGLSQDDVARLIGRDPSAVSRFERLDSDPHMSTIRRYARAVQADIRHVVSARGAKVAPIQPMVESIDSLFDGILIQSYGEPALARIRRPRVKLNELRTPSDTTNAGITDSTANAESRDTTPSRATDFLVFQVDYTEEAGLARKFFDSDTSIGVVRG